jgi:hypothetical protein
MPERKDRSNYVVRKLSSHDEMNSGIPQPTPEECLGMMWELTRNAYAFKGCSDAEFRLQRHVGGIVRRGR